LSPAFEPGLDINKHKPLPEGLCLRLEIGLGLGTGLGLGLAEALRRYLIDNWSAREIMPYFPLL